MDLRRILFLILTGGVISLAALVLFLGRTDPYFLGAIGWLIFSLALLVATASLFTSLGLWLRLWRLNKQADNLFRTAEESEALKTSIRQGILLTLFLAVILVLQIFRLLAWWNFIIAVFVFAFTELYLNIENLRTYRNKLKK